LHDPRVVTADELQALAIGGNATQKRYLVLDLGNASANEQAAAWLKSQPYAVIALPPPPHAVCPLIEACDVVLESPSALSAVIANIERSPIAASVLVQTLRATARLGPEDALAVESLAYATLQAGPEFARWQAERKKPGTPPADRGPPVILARDGDSLSVELNRPLNRNAISVEMRDALVEAFALAAADRSIATMGVSGAGACFSIGGDLAEFGLAPDPAFAHMIRMERLPARALLASVDRTTFHLHGACIGAGIELPAFAARVTAQSGAFFQLPEIRFGLIPGAGGCVSLPRRIGRQRTAYLALSGRRISARTALAWGLIDAITA
jgi:enoyl-CoA hydratase